MMKKVLFYSFLNVFDRFRPCERMRKHAFAGRNTQQLPDSSCLGNTALISFLIFPKIDSDAPRQKTVHGGLCLDECVANTIGNYFQCSTQWWMYNKVRSMNWDLCSIGNYTGKLLLWFLLLLFVGLGHTGACRGCPFNQS